MISEKLKKGNLLIAEPSIIGDLSFNRSVILLADHSRQGSVGFIINKPLKYTIKDLIPEIDATFEIYNGGPVEQDNLYFIHNIPELIPNSIEISSGIYWGGDFELTKTLINDGKVKKDNIRFFLRIYRLGCRTIRTGNGIQFLDCYPKTDIKIKL